MVERNNVKSTFSYDANGNRYKQVKQQNGSVVSTTYYVGSFEREVTLSSTVDKTYIGDHTIKMKAHVGSLGNQSPFQHVLRDHLGSVDTLMDARTGAVLQHRGYDVFGRPRDIASGNTLLSGTNWQGVTKGYTNHEHLIDQELIHMNGRIYDFNVGRFLSVDPFLQFPENSQSANPYSYILNNPMSGVDPTGYRSEELDEVISGKAFEKLEKDESGNLYVTADGETYKLTSVSNGEKNFSISFDGNGGGTAQVGKTTGTVSLHKGNSSTNVGGEQQKDKGVNGNIDKKTLKKLSRNTKNKMNSAIRLARKKMTSFCAASPSDCVDLSVDEFDSTPFEWSKNKDSLHPDDRISKRKHIGAIVERFGPDNKVKSVQLFAGGIVLQGKTTTSGLAEVLLHEYWHTSSPGTAAFKGGGDFETPAYKWSQAVMNHDTGE